MVRAVLRSAVVAVFTLGASAAAAQSAITARAEMVDLQGNSVGRATFTQTMHGVLVRVELSGLPPGWHGIHIHETAACQPPFASAGAHFSPGREQHGYFTEGLHAGDLPNIYVGADGKAAAEMLNDRVALTTDRPTDVGLFNRAIGAVQSAAGMQAHNLLTGNGTSLIIHARPDDYRSNPDGDSGDRIACGVIQLN